MSLILSCISMAISMAPPGRSLGPPIFYMWGCLLPIFPHIWWHNSTCINITVEWSNHCKIYSLAKYLCYTILFVVLVLCDILLPNILQQCKKFTVVMGPNKALGPISVTIAVESSLLDICSSSCIIIHNIIIQYDKIGMWYKIVNENCGCMKV